VTDFADSDQPLSWDGLDHWVGGEHDPELRGMSWPELQRLEQAGWEIASHTLTHPHLTTLGDDALARELHQSRAACERALGHPVTSIAYPYGSVDERVKRATAAAGSLQDKGIARRASHANGAGAGRGGGAKVARPPTAVDADLVVGSVLAACGSPTEPRTPPRFPPPTADGSY